MQETNTRRPKRVKRNKVSYEMEESDRKTEGMKGRKRTV
jgi:hypothetical protein